MPNPRLSMRKTKEIIRLSSCGLSLRQISNSAAVSVGKASDIVKRACAASLQWPLPEGMDDVALENVLYPESFEAAEADKHVPDWAEISKELRRKGVTRQLLWREYKQRHPDGYEYSRFCELYRAYKKKLEPVLRQEYAAGEKLFVDWAGQKIGFWENGKQHQAHVFVAAMGASNYTFVQVYRDETQSNWDMAHIECFEYLGGVPEIVVPDNTKTGVTKACYYEPELNPNYTALVNHYQAVVIPARPGEPTDKAKVETAVQIAEREVLAPLRKVEFQSFGQLREAIATKCTELNQRPFQELPGSRLSLFEEVDKPVLRPLPATRYELGSWLDAKVHPDYHISVDKHYYSVPFRHIGELVNVRLTARTVEIYLRGQRIAAHARSHERAKATTQAEHRPPQHSALMNRTRDNYLARGQKVGPFCEQILRKTMEHFPHPEMGFRSCDGILRLARQHPERIEQACSRCLDLGLSGFRVVDNTLRNNLENQIAAYEEPPIPNHRNIRGRHHYSKNS